jgi:hypothetical protein
MKRTAYWGSFVIISACTVFGLSDPEQVALSVGGSNLSRGESGDSVVIGNDGYPVPVARIASVDQAVPVIDRGRNLAVSGTVLLFSSIAVEQLVLNPWGNRVLDKYSRDTTHEDSAASAGDMLLVVGAGLPVSVLKIVGASMACAGASRAYGAYHDGIDPSTADIHVWKPYVIGWVLGAVGTVTGFIGGLGNSPSMETIGSVFSLGRDLSWSVAAVWSVVYAGKIHHQTAEKRRVLLIPYSDKGCGFTLKMDY